MAYFKPPAEASLHIPEPIYPARPHPGRRMEIPRLPVSEAIPAAPPPAAKPAPAASKRKPAPSPAPAPRPTTAAAAAPEPAHAAEATAEPVPAASAVAAPPAVMGAAPADASAVAPPADAATESSSVSETDGVPAAPAGPIEALPPQPRITPGQRYIARLPDTSFPVSHFSARFVHATSEEPAYNSTSLPDENRHNSKCAVCNHPDRESIESDFIAWRSVTMLAREFDVQPRSIYRHAVACDLFSRRSRNVRMALEQIIQRADSIMVTPSSIVQAVKAHARISSQGQWRNHERRIHLDISVSGSAQEPLPPATLSRDSVPAALAAGPSAAHAGATGAQAGAATSSAPPSFSIPSIVASPLVIHPSITVSAAARTAPPSSRRARSDRHTHTIKNSRKPLKTKRRRHA